MLTFIVAYILYTIPILYTIAVLYRQVFLFFTQINSRLQWSLGDIDKTKLRGITMQKSYKSTTEILDDTSDEFYVGISRVELIWSICIVHLLQDVALEINQT